MLKVFLGIGHGGADPGAVANGFKEEDLNLSIGKACRDELERNGVTVLMSRTVDENDPMSDVIKECNAFDPDLAADIHNNAGKGDGYEAYCHHLDYDNDGPSKILAKNIEAEVVALGQNSRGVKKKLGSTGKDYYAFIRSTKCPAVVLEGAFLDNPKDVQFIDTAAEQVALGKAYARGILKTLGVDAAAPWYQEAKTWCVNRQITDGTRPNDPATRAEVWAMLYRLNK